MQDSNYLPPSKSKVLRHDDDDSPRSEPHYLRRSVLSSSVVDILAAAAKKERTLEFRRCCKLVQRLGCVSPPPHSCLRGGHRNLTNPWCFGPEGLPTTLNISTNIVLYLAIASSLCNLAISDSSQNIVKNYSIRVSTKIRPHFLAQILENSQP